jgi:ABC-type sugar transport system permease subunit
MLEGIWYSFTNWNGLDADYKFVGLRELPPALRGPAGALRAGR